MSQLTAKLCLKSQKNTKVNDIQFKVKKLSTDKTLTIDVINYITKKQNLKDVYIILLQVNSPFSDQKIIKQIFKEFDRKKNFQFVC